MIVKEKNNKKTEKQKTKQQRNTDKTMSAYQNVYYMNDL